MNDRVLVSPSRYASREEALSPEFGELNRVFCAINRQHQLGDFTKENRLRFPWASGLTVPEPYASRLWEYPWAIREASLVPGLYCADVGCGQTPFTVYLAENTGCRVVGFDPLVGERTSRPYWGVSESFAARTSIHFVRSDVEQLRWHDNSFDRVFCISVIEHIKGASKQAKGLREIARVLKAGGRAIVSVDVFLRSRMVDPLMLIWESGLCPLGTIDLKMPRQRFGITDNGQPADVFGFVLEKPSGEIETEYATAGAASCTDIWKACSFRDLQTPEYSGREGRRNPILEAIERDLGRDWSAGRPSFRTIWRIAAKLVIGKYRFGSTTALQDES